MARASREFQVFVKPAGAQCNLACVYCYYLTKSRLYPGAESFRMAGDILEAYIRQHIEAAPHPEIAFSWHGGEPTILGLNFFRQIVAVQNTYRRPGDRIRNGIQTNGILLNEEWGLFLAEEDFAVGLSLDGPPELHDRHRVTPTGRPTHRRVMRGYEILRRHRIACDILCVVNADNVRYPAEVYGFFKDIGARYINFLPLVEPRPASESGVSGATVPAEAWGDFLCTVFDLWKQQDIGRVKVQIFEETSQTALGRDHALCIFKPTCGDIPVIEHNGDFFSCDHFVDAGHRLGNIMETPLIDLLESPAQKAFGRDKLNTLPEYCRECEVLDMCNGGCPKNRFIHTPDGQSGLNYLCAGYKRFFNHSRPFVTELAALWRRHMSGTPNPPDGTIVPRAKLKIGRNDPCPCGSGLKYKKCCLGK